MNIPISDDIHRSPAIMCMARDLGITNAEAVGYAVALFCWTNKHRVHGLIDDVFIEHVCDWQGNLGALYHAFIDNGIIICDSDNVHTIVGWERLYYGANLLKTRG